MSDSRLFFGHPVEITKYGVQKYPQFKELMEIYYRSSEFPKTLSLENDNFSDLPPNEQHIFVSNLQYQILIQAIHRRGLFEVFRPVCSLPELESWLIAWVNSESIHSHIYESIASNIDYPVTDGILEIPEIVNCVKDLAENYDRLIKLNLSSDVEEYYHKAALWVALISAYITQGIRFPVSFACSWAFSENKKMEDSGKIISQISKEDELHLYALSEIISLLPIDDNDFEKIKKDTEKTIFNLFTNAIKQEKARIKHLFKEGSLDNLNEDLLNGYLTYISHFKLAALGFREISEYLSKPVTNPIRWMCGR